MRWPWNQNRQEQKLKHRLRTQARRQFNIAQREPQPPEKTSDRRAHRKLQESKASAEDVSRAQSIEPTESSAYSKDLHQSRLMNSVDQHETEPLSFGGTDLTLFVRKRGRAVAFGKRPRCQENYKTSIYYHVHCTNANENCSAL